MIRYTMDDNGERVTEMNIKKLVGFIGVFATVSVSLFGWGYNLSREVVNNTAMVSEIRLQNTKSEAEIDKKLVEMRLEIKELHHQNTDISKQLTELLHRQDVRISLLEATLINIKERK